ncbi:hypothetical protein OROHE_018044 [Orobanche hederae]
MDVERERDDRQAIGTSCSNNSQGNNATTFVPRRRPRIAEQFQHQGDQDQEASRKTKSKSVAHNNPLDS